MKHVQRPVLLSLGCVTLSLCEYRETVDRRGPYMGHRSICLADYPVERIFCPSVSVLCEYDSSLCASPFDID